MIERNIVIARVCELVVMVNRPGSGSRVRVRVGVRTKVRILYMFFFRWEGANTIYFRCEGEGAIGIARECSVSARGCV